MALTLTSNMIVHNLNTCSFTQSKVVVHNACHRICHSSLLTLARMRREGYSSCAVSVSVCVCVCVCVCGVCVCVSVCPLSDISPLELLFVLKTLSPTQRVTKVKIFVAFSLKPMRFGDRALPPFAGHTYIWLGTGTFPSRTLTLFNPFVALSVCSVLIRAEMIQYVVFDPV